MNSVFSLSDLLAEPTERKPVKQKAYCTSQVCCRYKKDEKWAFRPYVEVAASRFAIDCPKCGHALWHGSNPEELAG